jgi:uncharacterized LabA/DUF88 family protein
MFCPPLKKQAVFLIDGFNLYHSLVNPKFGTRLVKYKWLDLTKLCNFFLQSQESLKDIYYFTALCSWDTDKSDRHKTYIHANENSGVKVVRGKFKEVTKRCRSCKQLFKTHEEKRTDVNIGINLVKLAFQDEFDVAYVLSADSDLVPAVEEVKSLFPQKVITVIIPFGNCANEMKAVCHYGRQIKEVHLQSSQFAMDVSLNDGSIISCPQEWR